MPNLAKSALWVTFSEILFNISGFVIHSVLGRFLGPADYGRYGITITLTTMVIILIGNGIPTAMAKYISEYFETNVGMVKIIKKQAIILQTAVIGFITIAFFFSIPLICQALGDPTLIPLFRISTLIIPTFAAASFYFSYYTGLHKFNLQATLKTLRSIFRFVFIIGLAYFFRVEGSIIGYIIAPLSVFLVAYGIDKIKISKELATAANGGSTSIMEVEPPQFEYKKLITYAWQIVIFFLAYELLISIDLYLVKAILKDDAITGIYNGVLTVGRIPYYIFYAMTVFLLPVVSKSFSKNNIGETRNILNKSLKIILILLTPMVVLMSIYAKPILLDFYGKNYISGAPAMAILEYGIGFLTIFYVMSFAINGAGKTKVSMAISIFGFIINAFLNYFLIKKYGLIGSAIATTFSSFIIAACIMAYLRKKFGACIKLKSFLKVLTASVIMYFLSLLFSKGEIAFIFWSIILFGAYLLFLCAVGEITKKDFAYARNLIYKK